MNEQPQPQAQPLSRIQVLITIGVTAVVLLIVARLWLMLDNLPPLPVQFNWADAALGLGLGMGITGLSAVVYRLWDSYRNSADFYLALVIQPLVLPDLIWLGLLPGMSEELLFRGVMLPAFGLNWVGILLSSLCFGVVHFNGVRNWSYIVWATMIGMILGFSAMETGNLLVPILAHITTNFVSSVVWKLQQTPVNEQK